MEDSRTDTAQLWLAGASGPPRRVAAWSVASKPLGPLPLVAAWIDADTLVYVEPGDVQSGLPREMSFEQLSLHPDGSATTRRLFTEEIQGSDLGVLVTNLALSPDRTRLAYRLRHFTHADERSGVYDTVVVVPARSVGSRLEITRGIPGDGLSRSPDSRWLAFGLRRQVVIASPDGRDLNTVVTGDASAAYPLWVGPDQLWFSKSDLNSSRVMQVQVR